MKKSASGFYHRFQNQLLNSKPQKGVIRTAHVQEKHQKKKQ
jgi:hypothetical protein